MSFVVKILISVLLLLHAIDGCLNATAPISFNSKKQICCNGTISDRGNSTTMTCLGSRAYDTTKYVKCEGNELLEAPEGGELYMYRCCKNEATHTTTLYIVRTHMCIDGKIFERPSTSAIYDICNGQVYDTGTHQCCEGKLLDRNYEECCGENKVINTSTHICCSKITVNINGVTETTFKIHERTDKTLLKSCCGLDLFDFRTELCCDQTISSKAALGMEQVYLSFCCGRHPYNPSQQKCCTKWKYNATGSYIGADYRVGTFTYDMFPDCCGDSMYDMKTHMCCYKDLTVIRKPTWAVNNLYILCCGQGKTYTQMGQQCLNDKVYTIGNRSLANCGVKVYDSNTHLCCNDHVFAKDPKLTCCKKISKMYNPDTHKCCLDKILLKTDKDREADYDDCCAIGYNGNL